jgi:HAD superfamily hydrolase (TIGR01509 family)
LLPVYPRLGPLRYNRAIPQHAVTFDAGQTLIELDLDFLAARLAGRGVSVASEALAAATPTAWARYDEVVDAGVDHVAGWHTFMTAVLTGAGVADPTPHVAWLWTENPTANLWRRPIAGMVDLARELAGRGIKVAVLSNSEGRLAELLAEVGVADAFEVIVDSGRIGLEKPGRPIFDHTLAALHARDARATHIGDSWNADIAGARGAGWRAIWYGRRVAPVDDPDVAIARDATETRAALVRWGVL